MASGMRGDAIAIFRERQKGALVSGGSVRVLQRNRGEIEFSDRVVDRCCWCQFFCRSMPYTIGFPESGGEPA
jgi:hypothetical protein